MTAAVFRRPYQRYFKGKSWQFFDDNQYLKRIYDYLDYSLVSLSQRRYLKENCCLVNNILQILDITKPTRVCNSDP